MKKKVKFGGLIAISAACATMLGMTAFAQGNTTIKTGVYADEINLAGMTKEEATQAIESYVEQLGQTPITLVAANNQEVVVTAADLGMRWTNPQIIDEALELGAYGNVIERFKALKDLEHDNCVYKVQFQYNVGAIDDILADKCVIYNQEAKNYSLTRSNGAFIVTEGQVGYMLDVEASIDTVYEYLLNDWDYEPARIPLNISVDEPEGGNGELSEVKDLLATFTTSYKTSSSDRIANVENGCRLINSTLLYPGEEFSTYNTVSPFSTQNGYHMAGSYLNGKVVDSLGGGICQVSTTLYNAVLLSELEVTERHNHSMVVGYVDKSADAAIAESSGKDFRFKNNTDYPIYIEGYTQNKTITFNIYGKETRDPNHKVRYESEILETIPATEQIVADGSHGIGYISSQSAHTGYKARLWKIVTENGVEVSREVINKSTYKMGPKVVTVGVATGDPNAYAEIMAAIGTGSSAHVKNVIAILTAPPAETPQ